jgi:DNA-binding transcriptional ArsR family regulator
MSTEVFGALADPTRRRILQELGQKERSVGELVGSLDVSQPAISKHLRVLRESGVVVSRTAAQQRFYRVEPQALAAIDEWLQPFRALWTTHLDRLERYLDAEEHRSLNE